MTRPSAPSLAIARRLGSVAARGAGEPVTSRLYGRGSEGDVGPHRRPRGARGDPRRAWRLERGPGSDSDGAVGAGRAGGARLVAAAALDEDGEQLAADGEEEDAEAGDDGEHLSALSYKGRAAGRNAGILRECCGFAVCRPPRGPSLP